MQQWLNKLNKIM